jgi:putative peptidoglycan lipid II flippase
VSVGLARSAGLISVATMGSRVLGLVRNFSIAYFFGAGDAVDAYNVAARLPVLLRELFAEGSMSAAFVPTFTRTLKDGGPQAAWRLASQVINALLLVTGSIVVIGIVFADPLVTLYAGDYGDTPGKLELTIELTRITMPFLTLIALAAVFMGMLNAMRRFFLPALSPAMFNVGLILGAVLSGWVGTTLGVQPIVSLAVGFVLGGFAQMAVQWPTLRRAGFRHQWVLDPRDRGLREVLMLMGPGTVGQAAGQINLLVSTILATSLGEGAISWLMYAFTFMYLPIGIFGVSVSTASIPDLALHAGSRAWSEMRKVLSAALRLMLMLTVPSSVGLIVLAAPIIELTLQYGAFSPDDTRAVATALMVYAPGLMGYSIVKIATPSFYAMQDARTPVTISIVAVRSSERMTTTKGFWDSNPSAPPAAAVRSPGVSGWPVRGLRSGRIETTRSTPSTADNESRSSINRSKLSTEANVSPSGSLATTLIGSAVAYLSCRAWNVSPVSLPSSTKEATSALKSIRNSISAAAMVIAAVSARTCLECATITRAIDCMARA